MGRALDNGPLPGKLKVPRSLDFHGLVDPLARLISCKSSLVQTAMDSALLSSA